MPRGDGTGPMGRGPMTGRGAGFAAAEALRFQRDGPRLRPRPRRPRRRTRSAKHVPRYWPDGLATGRDGQLQHHRPQRSPRP